MTHPQDLEAAIAEAERMLAEQDAALEAFFTAARSADPPPVHIDERVLTEIANFQPLPRGRASSAVVIGTRC